MSLCDGGHQPTGKETDMETAGFRKTHPLVLGAAASVLVVSLVSAAAIGGLLPSARSGNTDTPAQGSAPAADSHGT
jgi:hypothetical protein